MRIHASIAALGLTLTTSLAHASLVELTTTGTFSNPEGPATAVPHWSGVGTDVFSWGNAYTEDYYQSHLAFDGATATVNTDSGDIFSFGTLEFRNGVIVSGTGATGVDLTVSVDAAIAGSGVQSFDIGIINTPNIINPWVGADYVTIDAELGSADLTMDGEAYVLEFLGFGSMDGDGFLVGDQFRVFEGGSASAHLMGQLTPASATVPELSARSFAAPMFLVLGAAAILVARRRPLIKHG
jgi:hypothetical protein